jgi:hypothetical protein
LTGTNGFTTRIHRAARDRRHRRKVAQRIDPELLVERHVDRHRRGGDQQRVAIRRRFRHMLLRDVGPGTRTVLDDHRLAKVFGKPEGEQARVDIDPTAGRESDH